jgi:MipA family protein
MKRAFAGRWPSWGAGLAAAGLCAAASAQVSEPAPTPAAEPVAAPTPTPPRREIEGAIGLLIHRSPAYPGARDTNVRVNPAGFLRWGRFTLTGAGGFTTRRNDEVDRGLGAELVTRPNLRVKLSLRYDNGRSDDDSPRLAGLGDIPRTVRARLSAQWQHEAWRVGAGISADALKRGGGYFADLSVSHQWNLAPGSQITLSAGLSGAGDRYMQLWHGVTPEQSQRSGLPVFQVGEGLRDLSLGLVWRREFSPRWAGFAGVSASRMVGPAVDSPLTLQPSSVSASSGLVWRF